MESDILFDEGEGAHGKGGAANDGGRHGEEAEAASGQVVERAQVFDDGDARR